MKTLEAQRARYLKMVEAAGNPEVLQSVERLEHETAQINMKHCKEELTDRYIRTGSLSYDYAVVHCNTKQVYVPKKDQTRTKEYFEKRNPNAFLSCSSYKDMEGTNSYCIAYLKPESLFEEKK